MGKESSKSDAEEIRDQVNDVLRIRDIIFGEQMREYDARFAAIGERLDALQAQLEALDKRYDERMTQAQNETDRRLAELQSLLLARLDALDHKATARVNLGDMLIELGERLKSDGA